LPTQSRDVFAVGLLIVLGTARWGGARSVGEVRRVLKPSGRLLFAEHGRAPDAGVARWQDRITPVWKHVAGGCHLNRKPDDLIRSAGFAVEALETGYLKGPRPMGFVYAGSARAA
jgi:SAM-dependent methyltransferase